MGRPAKIAAALGAAASIIAGGVFGLGSSCGCTVTAPESSSPPSISGTTTQGQVLTASNGSWLHSPTSFTYQWEDCDASGANCTAIGGATSSTYTLAASDVGATVRVVATAVNGTGQASSSSLASGVIAGTGITPNFFVAQTASGTGAGSGSCSNAAPVSSLSTATHWTAGNVIGLCGTITSSITAQGSGTAGNPITVYWEPSAKISEPACPGGNGGCVVLSNQSWIVLNGGSNGIIEDTANGTSGITNTDSKGITAKSCNNCTIENLTIQNMYVRTSTSDTCGNVNGCGAIETANNAVALSGSNITLANNNIHDCGWCVQAQLGAGNVNVAISGNNIYNMDHGIALDPTGDPGGNVFVYGNHIHDLAAWDCGGGCHHDPFHCFGSTNGRVYTGIYIYDNRVDGNWGATPSSATFIEGNYGQAGDTPCAAAGSPVWQFNNYATDTNTTASNCCGMLGDSAPAGGEFNNTVEYTNNTINTGNCLGYGASAPGGTSTDFLENNVMDGCNTLITGAVATSGRTTGTFAAGTPDYDAYINGGSNSFSGTGPSGASCNFLNFSQYSTWTSCMGGIEAHGAGTFATDASAGLNSDGSLSGTSPLLGAGNNLTSTCAGFPTTPVNVQAACETTYTGPPPSGTAGSTTAGSPRPSTGVWNIGAY